MNSLTPFIRHELEHRPGPSAAPENSCTRCSPPLGKEPPLQPPAPPEDPGTQLPPPDLPQPGQTPHPGTDSRPLGASAVPMTDGTPAACHQKNAQEFLAGRVPGVMAQYAPGLFSTRQHLYSRNPAPDEDTAAVQELVDWREDAPYG